MATARPTDEGAEFTFTTVEGIEIKFLLDDMAVALLGLTMGAVHQEMKGRVKPVDGHLTDKSAMRLFEKEGTNNG